MSPSGKMGNEYAKETRTISRSNAFMGNTSDSDSHVKTIVIRFRIYGRRHRK